MALTTGYGSKFWRKDATTYEQIADVASISPPSSDTAEAEIEELDGDGYTKSLPGLTDPGEVQVTLNFNTENQGHLALIEDREEKAVKDYRITLPGGQFGWDFKGWVKTFEVSELAGSEVIQATVTIRVTGSSAPGPITVTP